MILLRLYPLLVWRRQVQVRTARLVSSVRG
ncbi:hypothetical protein E2C01_033494 [Portunus trituberculatus]|uniref:Uncharacterized protein n=1 Tax=Portunus trituberculatus TaxID=210409 RepID=A0A5B7EYU0_PORTR|nr:hypothetical protein [Portunus trituberculatus]